MLVHKTSIHKFKKIRVISNIFSAQKLEINYKKKRNVETATELKALQILKKDIYGLLKVTITTSMSAEGQVEEPSPVEK